ncbi:glycosyltransferase, partial [Morganella morganii]
MTYSKNEIIKDKVTFGNTSLKPDSAICVAFGVDSIFIKATVVSMLSFIENNDGVFFDFNIITSSIDNKDINFINELTFDNYAITIHIINEHFFDGYQEKENLPVSMYYRLLIPYILHIHTDRVLYVDA